MEAWDLNSKFIADWKWSAVLRLQASSVGWDSITAVVLKFAERAIPKPITHMLNLTVTSEYFPTKDNNLSRYPFFQICVSHADKLQTNLRLDSFSQIIWYSYV